MKYNIRAFSIKVVNQTDEILVWFKGPLFYRSSIGEMRFVFPWNVSKIQLKNVSAFPILFWGFKGKQILNIDEVGNDAFKWESGKDWSCITSNSIINHFNEEEIKNSFVERISTDFPPLNEMVKNTSISYEVPNLTDVSKEQIPQSILDYKIK
jgi:hypothetical protein